MATARDYRALDALLVAQESLSRALQHLHFTTSKLGEKRMEVAALCDSLQELRTRFEREVRKDKA